jgi:hypothetical protein
MSLMNRVRALLATLLGASASFPVTAAPVLLISIDGMRPDYVTQADVHHLKIPTLRSFLTSGSYAEGVIGVTPTVTFPSHTTLVTGVTPLEHGIYDNAPFDPMHENNNGLYWYSKDIRAVTLWQAADRAGLVTASIAWPVTVGAPWIRYNVPEYGLGATDDVKLIEAIATPTGMLARLETKLGPYTRQGDKQEDAVRTRLAAEILKEFKPDFMTVHFNGLDDRSHEHGPFSAAADATLEAIDTMVADLRAAALANNPATVIVVVSDHGFASVERAINWRIPFTAKHLIDPQSSSWSVDVWPGDGSAAVMLRNPYDVRLRAQVAAVLAQLASDAPKGSMRIISGAELQRLNGWPNAAFVIDLTPGYVLGDANAGALVTPKSGGGTHGYLPDHREMRAAFLIAGQSIAAGRDLGTIDMRQVAPTLARILGVHLSAAAARPLDVMAVR